MSKIAIVLITMMCVAANTSFAQYDNITAVNEKGIVLSLDENDWDYPGCFTYQVGDTIPVRGFISRVLPQCSQILPPVPNPANDSTTFYFALPSTKFVSLLFRVTPQDSIVLVEGLHAAGYHAYYWRNIPQIPPGLYKCEFRAGDLKVIGDIKIGGGVGDIEERNAIPRDVLLMQNFPNPFNPATTIHYSMEKSEVVQIVIYDELGRVVRALVNMRKPGGTYDVIWDGKNEQGRYVPAGIYFYTLKVGEAALVSKRMVLIK